MVIMKNVANGYIERRNLALGVVFLATIGFTPQGLVPSSVRLCAMAWQAPGERDAAFLPRTQGDGGK